MGVQKKCERCEKRLVFCTCGVEKFFGTPENLQKAIDEYFENHPPKEWLITGLCSHIGLDVGNFLAYTGDQKFRLIIEKARVKISQPNERRLHERGKSADIFMLKNVGFSDQRQVDITSKNEKLKGFMYTNPEDENDSE